MESSRDSKKAPSGRRHGLESLIAAKRSERSLHEESSRSTKFDLMDAARSACAMHGSATSVSQILELSGHGASALYYHYRSRTGLIGALLTEMQGFVESRIREIQAIESPQEALVEWLGTGIQVVANYGVLGLEAASESLPPNLACGPGPNTTYEFTDTLLQRLRDSGECHPAISTRAGARLWICLAHPKRFIRALNEGMTLREIEVETLEWFYAVFSPDYRPEIEI